MAAGAGACRPVEVIRLLRCELQLEASRHGQGLNDLWMRRLDNPSVLGWRRQIVEWLQEVATEFVLDADTVATAVTLLDRLLCRVEVPPEHLQVAALACIYLVSKMHERRPLRACDVRDWFSAICSPEDLRRAELNCCHSLGWNLNAFTPLSFARAVLQLVPDVALSRMLTLRAEQFATLALADFDLLPHPASTIGFACVAASCARLGFDVRPLYDGLVTHDVPVQIVPEVVHRLTSALEALEAGRSTRASTATVSAQSTPQGSPQSNGDASWSSREEGEDFMGRAETEMEEAAVACKMTGGSAPLPSPQAATANLHVHSVALDEDFDQRGEREGVQQQQQQLAGRGHGKPLAAACAAAAPSSSLSSSSSGGPRVLATRARSYTDASVASSFVAAMESVTVSAAAGTAAAGGAGVYNLDVASGRVGSSSSSSRPSVDVSVGAPRKRSISDGMPPEALLLVPPREEEDEEEEEEDAEELPSHRQHQQCIHSGGRGANPGGGRATGGSDVLFGTHAATRASVVSASLGGAEEAGQEELAQGRGARPSSGPACTAELAAVQQAQEAHEAALMCYLGAPGGGAAGGGSGGGGGGGAGWGGTGRRQVALGRAPSADIASEYERAVGGDRPGNIPMLLLAERCESSATTLTALSATCVGSVGGPAGGCGGGGRSGRAGSTARGRSATVLSSSGCTPFSSVGSACGGRSSVSGDSDGGTFFSSAAGTGAEEASPPAPLPVAEQHRGPAPPTGTCVPTALRLGCGQPPLGRRETAAPVLAAPVATSASSAAAAAAAASGGVLLTGALQPRPPSNPGPGPGPGPVVGAGFYHPSSSSYGHAYGAAAAFAPPSSSLSSTYSSYLSRGSATAGSRTAAAATAAQVPASSAAAAAFSVGQQPARPHPGNEGCSIAVDRCQEEQDEEDGEDDDYDCTKCHGVGCDACLVSRDARLLSDCESFGDDDDEVESEEDTTVAPNSAPLFRVQCHGGDEAMDGYSGSHVNMGASASSLLCQGTDEAMLGCSMCLVPQDAGSPNVSQDTVFSEAVARSDSQLQQQYPRNSGDFGSARLTAPPSTTFLVPLLYQNPQLHHHRD